MRHIDFPSDSMDSNPQEGKTVRNKTKNIPVLLSIDKAAKLSGLGRNNLAYLIKYHKLPVVKLPGYNRIKIHYDDLINFIENNKCIYGGALQSRLAGKSKAGAKRSADNQDNQSHKTS